MVFFCEFQYGFRSSRSTADLLKVMPDRILRVLTGLGLLDLQHLIYPRLLTGFGMFRKFVSYGISGEIFGLIFSFVNNILL